MHRIAYLAAVPLLTPVLLLVVTSAGADPPPGARWVPIPALTDEFEAEVLDGRKWTDHNPNWKGRKPGYFSPANVRVHDGKLHLTAKAEDLPDLPEGYHTFTTAAVRSIADVRYGYFEIKCRPMRSRASSAFWFYKTEPDTWTEIDVFEIGGGAPDNERIYHMNAHVFRTPEYKGTVEKHLTHPGFWKAPYDLAAEYHVYGLEWDEEEIAWYVDGKRVRTLPNQYWHQRST